MRMNDLRNIRLFRCTVDHTTAGKSRIARTLRPPGTSDVSLPPGRYLVVRRRSTTATGGQRALERVPEVSVEQRVDERVESRVDVSDPEQNGHNDRRCFEAEVAAQRVVDIPCEERQPAAEERSHYHAECFGCFMLAFHLPTLWSLSLRAVWNAVSLRRRQRRGGHRRDAVAGR